MLLSQDEGEYFDENGAPREELGVEYYKVKEFEIRPRVKAP